MLNTSSATRTAALLAALSVSAGATPALAQDAAANGAQPPATADDSAAAVGADAPAAATAEAAADGSASPADAGAATAAAPLDTIPVKVPPPRQAPAAAVDVQGPAQIAEIIVTATKRTQSIRDIPASITAFTGEDLENTGKLNLNDFVQESPGVTAAQGSPGFTRLTFRGISTDTNPYSGNAQPVGIFIGDVPFTDPYVANIIPDLSAFDLSDVEVLKGPQGTLFGGAALSGAIRYQLQEPQLDTWQARGFSQYAKPKDGSSAFTEGLSVNAPLFRDDLAVRLAYVRREYPGTMDNLRTGEKDVDASSGNQYRGQLLWQPGNWKFKYTHLQQDFQGDDQLLFTDSPRGPRASDVAITPQPSQNEFHLDSLESAYDFDGVRAVSLSSWVKRDANYTKDYTSVLIGTPPPGYPAEAGVFTHVVDNSKSFSQELRLQSDDGGPFTWLVGAYYFDYRMYFNILIDTQLNQDLLGQDSVLGSNPAVAALFALLGAPSAAATTSLLDGTSNAKSTEKALFADLSYEIADALTLSAGGRFYRTEVTGGFVGSGLLIAGNENDGPQSNSVATLKESGFNPKLSATWRFADNASIYATAAKGFRFGGLQDLPSTPTNGVPPTYKSDTLWNYEIGLRTDWLHKTLQADLTAFYIDYKNPIITQSTQGIPIAYNTNVSAAISRGFESSLLWNTPLRGLTWSLSGAVTDAHITKSFTASDGQVVEPGQEMPGAAKYQFNSSLQYLHAWKFLTLAPIASYTYVGKGYSDITHQVEINGYGSFNAGLLIGADGLWGSPKLALNVNNILDVTRPVAGGTGTTLVTRQPTETYLLNQPRTITARFSFEF
ncbi:TonB-dependent receptor [Solimonas terrae]|uniref:TonB-dependent receptor n=1 Tax=Solimonas terrae TaxID=1396819 RepID=A0A6M2BLU8_9GAMM|nr:TonB-dependent receptor [Solimonas terrae]NGY03251.1 TonB-dependent receptor [Solimonas terrae]